jgi:acetyltransferase-like isoleucine patch superfamily enzyme
MVVKEVYSMKRKNTKPKDLEIYHLLSELHRLLRDDIKQKWNRSLPFTEELFDRWERAKYLGFGDGASVYDSSIIIGAVKVGKKTWIGPFSMLDGSGGLEIGEYCSISAGVQIYTHDSIKWALSGGKEDYEKAPVVIGNRCYIGPNTVITRGVTIGNGCIIGANSFVDKNIPSGSKAWGNPCNVKEKI